MGAASPNRTRKAVTAKKTAAAPVVDPTEDFYGPPAIARLAAAADDESLDFATPTREQRAAVPMEKLFSIDGQEFFIPVTFGPGMGLIYLDGVSEGRDVALGRVLKKAIGEAGWQALIGYSDYITAGQMAKLLDITLRKTLGALEESGEGNG